MTMRLTAAAATVALLAAGPLTGTALADDADSCQYVQKNMFAGPIQGLRDAD